MSKARDLADLLKASGDVKTEHLDEAAKRDMTNVTMSAVVPPAVAAAINLGDSVVSDALEEHSLLGL